MNPLTLDAVLELALRGAQILDTRDPTEFAAAHLAGSINVGLGGQYATWVGTVLDHAHPIVIIATPGRENEPPFASAASASTTSPAIWRRRAQPAIAPDVTTTTDRLSAPFAAERSRRLRRRSHRRPRTARARSKAYRRQSDPAQSPERPRPSADDRPLLVYCAGGYRSSIAASLLESRGFHRVQEIAGGIAAWEAAHLPVLATHGHRRGTRVCQRRRSGHHDSDATARRWHRALRVPPLRRGCRWSPVLCLQHFTGTLDNWDPAVIDPLAAGREVILFDNAGIGRSSGTVPPTVAGMATHAFAFLDGLGVTTCDVLGFSLGGMIAQQNGPRSIVDLQADEMLVGTAPRGGEDIMHLDKPRLAKYLQDPTFKGFAVLQKIFFALTATSQAAGQAFTERLAQRTADPGARVWTSGRRGPSGGVWTGSAIPASGSRT